MNTFKGRLPDNNLALWVSMTPHDVVKQWLRAEGALPLVNIELFSAAIDRVCEDADEVDQWKGRLAQMRQIPGRPRLIYLLNTTANIPGDTDLVLDALRDPTLNDIHFVLLARQYQHRIDLSPLHGHISERKAEYLRRMENSKPVTE